MTVRELVSLINDTQNVTSLLSQGVRNGVSGINKTVLEDAQRLLEIYYDLVADQEVKIVHDC